jgi:hypothetical protein
MTRALTTLMMLGLLVVPAMAQETPAEPATRTATPLADAQAVNIQVELTITEQVGKTQPAAKTVSAVALNESVTRIRSGTGTNRIELNVDMSPKVRAQGQIVLGLTVQYSPRGGTGVEGGGAGDERAVIPSLNQSLTVLLQNGKPLVVSQSADPNSDRKVTLEVKATILR